MQYQYDLTTTFQVAVTENLKNPYTRRSSNLDIPKAYSGTQAVTPLLEEDLLELCR